MELRALAAIVFVSTTAALGASGLLAGCSGGSSGTGGSGTGGGGGGSGGGGPSAEQCAALCDHVSQIDCSVWPNCPADCSDRLGAPASCAAAFDALLACWAENLPAFTCSLAQVLPPEACGGAADAFHACFGADTSCICSPGVGNSQEGTCVRNTACGDSEFSTVCQEGASGAWDCACYDHESLLGTCTEGAEIMPHCDNQVGCCAAYFCAPK